MKTILQIYSSINGTDSQSSKLSDVLAEGLMSRTSRAKHVTRDLSSEPFRHLTGVTFRAFADSTVAVTPEQVAGLALSDRVIEEVMAADTIIIGAPMYNFGIPSTLKAWIDHVTRANVTFRMTDSGPEGLVVGKEAYIVVSRGGIYRGTSADTQTAYLTMALGLIGIVDLTFIYAEGLAMGEDAAATGMSAAHRSIQQLVAAA